MVVHIFQAECISCARVQNGWQSIYASRKTAAMAVGEGSKGQGHGVARTL